MTDTILLQIDERVAFVTFNRPERLNAIDLAMARAFREVVDGLAASHEVRAVVLRGAGAAFVAGGDIKLFSGDRQAAAATIGELIDHFHAATVGLQQLSAPVIASVHGAAAGGGFSLALCADFRIAADTATFTPGVSAAGHIARRRRHVLPAEARRPEQGAGDFSLGWDVLGRRRASSRLREPRGSGRRPGARDGAVGGGNRPRRHAGGRPCQGIDDRA